MLQKILILSPNSRTEFIILIYFDFFIDEAKRKAQENTDINRQQQGRKNLEKNDAAIIIQSRMYIQKSQAAVCSRHFYILHTYSQIFTDFRGYTIRKRFGYELEERFKRILNNYDNIYDGHKALLREGLKHEDAALIVQRWYKKEEKVVRKKPSAKDPIHPKLRQADLIQFSQNVSENHNSILN